MPVVRLFVRLDAGDVRSRRSFLMIVRDKNGIVDVDEHFKLSPEHKKDMERLPEVVEKWTELAFRETPTVAVSACISVLSREISP